MLNRKTSTESSASAFGDNSQVGMCGWYSRPEGSPTASGAPFNSSAMTGAHRFLPFGTQVHVTSGFFEDVINDRPEVHLMEKESEDILLVTKEGKARLGIWTDQHRCGFVW